MNLFNRKQLDSLCAALGIGLLIVGTYLGLVVAPQDKMMGDVYRIFFVHVPGAWMALVAYTVNFVASLVYMLKNSDIADSIAEASAEIGLLFNGLLIITGSIWGRPTWGVWWTWDPRLTTAAIMFCAFAGYVALRRFIDDIKQRAAAAAVVAIVIFADIPIVWFSVKWWNGLHQLQSSPATVAAPMVLALRVNAFAFLLIYVWFMRLRYRIAQQFKQQLQEVPHD